LCKFPSCENRSYYGYDTLAALVHLRIIHTFAISSPPFGGSSLNVEGVSASLIIARPRRTLF
jgi:hypothetical protein